jgi:hypothetical protein
MMFFNAGLLILANARAMGGAKNKSGTDAPQPKGFFHTEPKELSTKARQSGQFSMSSYRDKLQKSKWAGFAITATKVAIPLRLVCTTLSGILWAFSTVQNMYPKLFEWKKEIGFFHIAAHNFSHLLMTPSFAFAAMNGPTPVKVVSFTALTLSLTQLSSGIYGLLKFQGYLNVFTTGKFDDTKFYDFFQWKMFDDQGVRLIDMGVHAAFWILHFF